MRKRILTAFAVALACNVFAQFSPVQYADSYTVEVDIKGRTDDRIDITVIPPVQNKDKVVYAMPKIVPGTYDISDFGQFVRDVKAFDSRGNELSVERLDVNRWEISGGKSLYKITYEAEDSQGDAKAGIFLPGGTAIEEGGVLLNVFGFVGFMQGHDNLPYRFEVAHEAEVVGTTSLDIESVGEDRDVFFAQNYFELHDRPLIYAPDNQASMMVAGAEITVGAFSPSGHLNAQELLEGMAPVFQAAADYLGGTLPTDRYAVLIWGMTMEQVMQDPAVGALEHFTSTTLVMPDAGNETYAMFEGGGENARLQFLRSIVAHEFFHIITPLNIHSQHIHNYDFINPQMSKHLWFYEGLTEYNSQISQVRGGLITVQEFMDEMVEKMQGADQFKEYIPMTVRSEHALDIFADQYYDVYLKGALIGMALDLHIREATAGEEGLVDLLNTLKNVYGPDTFFVDDQFFSIIAEHTPEGTEEFLYDHIAGTAPLPFTALLDPMGYDYEESAKEYFVSEPDWNVSFIESRGKYYVINNWNEDDGLVAGFGLQKGDQLVRWNGEKVKGGKLGEMLAEWKESACFNDQVTIEVIRTDESGDEEEIELVSNAQFEYNENRHQLEMRSPLTAEEIAMRKAWLNQ